MDLHVKDAEALVSYAIDWGRHYLGARAIASSAWAVEPEEAGGVAVQSASHDFRQTAALVDGGVDGHVYRLANRVTLSDGSVDERSLTLRVEDR